jgi:tRNA(Ile)-lysidine synthase
MRMGGVLITPFPLRKFRHLACLSITCTPVHAFMLQLKKKLIGREDVMSPTLIHTIQKTGLIQHGDCVLVGLSGGPDSVCLLHALAQLRKRISFTLFSAHLNHNLRGMDANRDAGFAMSFSKELDVHCLVKSEDVAVVAREQKLSIEAAGRLCRYRFLNEVADKIGAGKIAVGHHLNDQAETMLMHLIRGTGLTGLTGMRPRRGRLIRPLLSVSREEVLAYCDANKLPYCSDDTNNQPDVLRNKIRLELVPVIQSYNPQIIRSLGRTASLLQNDEAALDQLSEQAFDKHMIKEEDEMTFSASALRDLPDAILSRVLRKAVGRLQTTDKTLQYEQLNNLIAAVRQCVQEKWFHLPGEIQVRVTESQVIVMRKEPSPANKKTMMPVWLKQNGVTWLPGQLGTILCRRIRAAHPVNFEADPMNQVISADNLTKDLVVRHRKQGDNWRPLGLGGTKSLKRTLIDLKVPRAERDKVLLICHGDDIIWVVGVQISEAVRVTQKTKQVLVVEFRPASHH